MSELDDFIKGNFNHVEQVQLSDGSTYMRLTKRGKSPVCIRVKGDLGKPRDLELIEILPSSESTEKIKEKVAKEIKEKVAKEGKK